VSSPSPADELVEEVDADGNVVRVVTRAQMRAEHLRHRCTYIGVMSTDGTKLLVHQRSFDKDVFPGWWDVVAGGVCAVGEDWRTSAGEPGAVTASRSSAACSSPVTTGRSPSPTAR
jgi:isopentenyldiphosphate isomerase